MRSIIFVLLILAAFFTACGATNMCGGPGQHCCGWPGASCVNGYRCDGTRCVSCGGEGQSCCSFETCGSSNLTCNSHPDNTWACEACGHAGQSCCDNGHYRYCADGSICNLATNTCGGGTNVCTTGANTYQIGLRSTQSHCALTVVTTRGNSLSDAQTCALSTVAAGAANTVTSGSIVYYEYSATNPLGQCSTGQYPAFSRDDARDCAQFNNLNSRIVEGRCP